MAQEKFLKDLEELAKDAGCSGLWKEFEEKAMQIPNLVLWHTEDSNVAGRERLYKSEGKKYYGGNIFVPDDESLIAL